MAISPQNNDPRMTKDWLEEQLCAAAGTSELRPFQRDLGYEIAVLRHDVFCTIAPGAGKSLLLLSGPLAAKARGESGIAVLVVPTKALAEQQVSELRVHY